MPAERVRHSKRNAAAQPEDPAMPAAPPVGPSASAPSFAFAPNVTPGTFNDPPSPTDSASEGLLFPATEGGSAPRRAAHAKKKPDNHIPRPPNAFILFRSSFIKNQHVTSQVETNHSTLSKIIGLTWQNLPHEERQVWHAKAKVALEEHKRKFPQYAFRPLHTKGKCSAEKRKVREVEPKDMKRCEKIAQLLIEGKKGAALNVAVEEFDKHHVPQVITRFEAPITARHYRRSSSAPIPDTEHTPFLKQEEQAPSPSTSKPKALKVRSSSSQPDASRSSPVYECPTPAPPSEADTESDYYSSPSSPYAPTPIYALPPQPPSFVDFATFTFNNNSDAAPAMSYQPCDPLDQQGPYEVYAPQEPQDSYVHTEMFDPRYRLTVDTSYAGSWPGTTSSSPLSSMPGTPLSYSAVHQPCDPTAVIESCFHPLSELYDQSAEYLPQPQDPTQLYSAGIPVPAYCTPAQAQGHPHGIDMDMDMAYGAAAHGQDFGGVPPKDDFSPFYGRQTLDPAVYAHAPGPYMGPMPPFTM